MTDYPVGRGRLVWVAIVAGVVTVFVALLFDARQPAYCMGVGEAQPTLALHAFQMARTPDKLGIALGCAERVAMLNAMNTLDLAAFIPAYATFLLFATALLARGTLQRLAFALIGIGVVADIVETATQLWIGMRWDAPLSPAMLPLLTLGSTVKFAALGLGTAVLGVALIRRRGIAEIILGSVVLIGGLASLLVFANVPRINLALAAAWVALLLALLLSAIRRPRHLPASAAA